MRSNWDSCGSKDHKLTSWSVQDLQGENMKTDLEVFPRNRFNLVFEKVTTPKRWIRVVRRQSVTVQSLIKVSIQGPHSFILVYKSKTQLAHFQKGDANVVVVEGGGEIKLHLTHKKEYPWSNHAIYWGFRNQTERGAKRLGRHSPGQWSRSRHLALWWSPNRSGWGNLISVNSYSSCSCISSRQAHATGQV